MRVALIGTGFGTRVVAGAWREVGADVDVVSPRDADAVVQAIAAPVDVVSVHSPPFLHAEHVHRALDAGHHVLCDKPFGLSAQEAREMAAHADAAGVLHFLNFEFRCEPPRVALHRLVHEGAIGALRHIHWTAFLSNSRIPLRPYGWLFDRERGGGWIGAFGSHMIDTIRWLAGEIVDVEGRLRTDIEERPDRDGVFHRCSAEDAFSASFLLAGGATATLDTAFAAAKSFAPRIILLGDEGAIELVGSTELTLRRADVAPQVTRFEPFDGDSHLPAIRPWLAQVRDAISEQRQIAPSFEDGVACADVMDRLRASEAHA